MSASAFQTFKPQANYQGGFWFDIGIESSEMAKNESVHQGFTPDIYRNILQRAQLSQSEFHAITHIPLSTIKRRLAKQERFSTQESDVMYRLAMLVKLASDLFESEERALEWMRESVYGLGGKRPLDMVATTVDFEQVKDLIGRVQHGVFT
ncbi:hypothetical protein BOO24_02500 [Vibrio navarrensis]|uniref:type II RES/Xre toxin-antitoxin system antitoxin n=1 Tax=Vibrio navarrensis TaxID=29495 RepID=UPI00186A6671|nr:antitoxin Xre/MbcA/ParS toxin-binding domain-containing protein [Vibrio navarrensis]MBE3668442.1 hypothetical protein [Vibrio navarrensis]MBE4591229.1 hypothetical protein [Vibrio navarrensis]